MGTYVLGLSKFITLNVDMMSWRKKWSEEGIVTVHPWIIRISWQTQVLLTPKEVMRTYNQDAWNAEQESKKQRRQAPELNAKFYCSRCLVEFSAF